MKRPERKYFEVVGKNYHNCYDDERYAEHLNAFIDYLLHKIAAQKTATDYIISLSNKIQKT